MGAAAAAKTAGDEPTTEAVAVEGPPGPVTPPETPPETPRALPQLPCPRPAPWSAAAHAGLAAAGHRTPDQHKASDALEMTPSTIAASDEALNGSSTPSSSSDVGDEDAEEVRAEVAGATAALEQQAEEAERSPRSDALGAPADKSALTPAAEVANDEGAADMKASQATDVRCEEEEEEEEDAALTLAAALSNDEGAADVEALQPADVRCEEEDAALTPAAAVANDKGVADVEPSQPTDARCKEEAAGCEEAPQPAEAHCDADAMDDSSTRPASLVHEPGLPARDMLRPPEHSGDAILSSWPSLNDLATSTAPASFSNEPEFMKAYTAMTGTASHDSACPDSHSPADAHPGAALDLSGLTSDQTEQRPVPLDGPEPSQSVHPGLELLVGQWRIVMGDASEVCTVCKNGMALYNGKHKGDRYDLVEDDSSGGMCIRRCDGWELDMKESKYGMLIWVKPGHAPVAWYRVVPPAAGGEGQGLCCGERKAPQLELIAERDQDSCSGTGTRSQSFEKKVEGLPSASLIRGSSLDLVQGIEIRPAGLFSCAACRPHACRVG